MSTLLLSNFLWIMAALVLLWAISVSRRDASIIDAFWGAGFVGVVWLTVVGLPDSEGIGTGGWLLVTLVTLWGMRLSIYLTLRFVGEHEEDRRYAGMRRGHGERFWWVSLFTVFGLQGVLVWLIALPLQLGLMNAATAETGAAVWWFIPGLLVFAVGLTFEALGDAQLAAFKSNPDNRGKVLDTGLWRWTRHPNYFGDATVWWGLFAVAVPLGAPLWTVFSPIVMSVLLMRVSGVTLLERDIADRRPRYSQYIKQTNAFFPGPRKS